MCKFAIIIVVCFLCTLTEGWIGMEAYNPKRDSKSHCFGEVFAVGALEKGERKRVPNECAEAVCLENRDVKYNGCAPMAAEPPCYVVDGNISKPFPQCCHEVLCDEDNKVEATWIH